MKVTTTVLDPVCGMDIDPENAAGQSELEGQTFFFCGTTCKAKFDAHPAQYPVKPAATA